MEHLHVFVPQLGYFMKSPLWKEWSDEFGNSGYAKIRVPENVLRYLDGKKEGVNVTERRQEYSCRFVRPAKIIDLEGDWGIFQYPKTGEYFIARSEYGNSTFPRPVAPSYRGISWDGSGVTVFVPSDRLIERQGG